MIPNGLMLLAGISVSSSVAVLTDEAISSSLLTSL